MTLEEIDELVYRRSRALLFNDAVTEGMKRWSNLGKRPAVWAPLALSGVVLDPARRRGWLRAGVAVGLAWAANEGGKRIVDRDRPDLADCPSVADHPDDRSFPSSHTSTAFAAAVAFSPLVPAVPLVAVATTQSIVRVALGSHWPSDILAGAVLGAAIGRLVRG